MCERGMHCMCAYRWQGDVAPDSGEKAATSSWLVNYSLSLWPTDVGVYAASRGDPWPWREFSARKFSTEFVLRSTN